MKKLLAILTALLTTGSCLLHAQGYHDLAFINISSILKKDSIQVAVSPVKAATSFESLNLFINDSRSGKVILDYSRQNRPIDAWYFPGTSDKNALIIGGMHGSELSAVEIAGKIISILSAGEALYYNVIVIPCLFPDNAATALANAVNPKDLSGRYTSSTTPDPNRQMPGLADAFDPEAPLDINGRPIEKENQVMLKVIQEFKPTRIVNLHAIRDLTKAGIYADPRTDCNGFALGYSSDSSLAVAMAREVKLLGGSVPGNHLSTRPTALYYFDPAIAPEGMLQKRNMNGSPVMLERGHGISLGSWASTAVCEEGNSRDAIRLFTVEFPGYRSSGLLPLKKERDACQQNIKAYAGGIVKVFLSANYVE